MERDPLNIGAFHRECPLETRSSRPSRWPCGTFAARRPAAGGGAVRRDHPRPQSSWRPAWAFNLRARGRDRRLYVEQGFSTLKTKAGSNMQEDLTMVRGVRDAVGGRSSCESTRTVPTRPSRPRNWPGGWRSTTSSISSSRSPPSRCPMLSGCGRQSQTKIALNESVTNPASVWEILRAEAAEFILPDTHEAGGIWPCVKIGHRLRSGRRAGDHALRPRPGAQDRRHGPRRRGLSGVFVWPTTAPITAWWTTCSWSRCRSCGDDRRAAPARVWGLMRRGKAAALCGERVIKLRIQPMVFDCVRLARNSLGENACSGCSRDGWRWHCWRCWSYKPRQPKKMQFCKRSQGRRKVGGRRPASPAASDDGRWPRRRRPAAERMATIADANTSG